MELEKQLLLPDGSKREVYSRVYTETDRDQLRQRAALLSLGRFLSRQELEILKQSKGHDGFFEHFWRPKGSLLSSFTESTDTGLERSRRTVLVFELNSNHAYLQYPPDTRSHI